MTRLKLVRTIRKIILILGGFALGALAVEIGLRIGGVSYPNYYEYDEYRGAALRPGAEGWWRKEGPSYIKINRHGLRDHEHPKGKPANTIRIAVLGDSYAEALQVPMENAFWSVMEQSLQEHNITLGKKVEVINLGVSGYGTAQELLTLRHHVWDYSPDLVLLAFSTGNDIRNNSRTLEKDPLRPYFVYRQGELVLDQSFRKAWGFRIRKSVLGKAVYGAIGYSRFLQVVNEAKNTRNVLRHLFPPHKEAVNGATQELGLDNKVFLEPQDPDWKEAWQITEALLILMRDEVAKHGAQFLVVTLSSGIQVHPDPLVRQKFMDQLGVQDLYYPDRRLKAFGDRHGFPVLLLAPQCQSYAEQNKVFLHGFGTTLGGGHWNNEGHRLAGKLIAEALRPYLPL